MRAHRLHVVAAALALALTAACAPGEPEAAAAAADATSAAPAVAGATLVTEPAIAAADIRARTEELAHDKWLGRAPGTPEGEASAQWIADEMARIGLEPAVDGSYFQMVEMVGITADPEASSLTFSINGAERRLDIGADAVFGSRRQDQTTVTVEDSDIVFVGHGVNAPEAGWNDYAGVDVRGKTVVMFVNDPGFATGDETLFGGRAMTYYGRWTYKFEEASRQGAAAALIIHETEPASYGWDVVQDSWTGEQADLVRSDAGASRTALEGWISLATAQQLFADAGLDFEALKAAANRPGFAAVPLPGAKASAVIQQTTRRAHSRNVAGTLRGAGSPDEHLIFTAHWDHLGVDPDAPPGEDAIYNGAVDNATGVAAILEIAEALAAGPRPARSITFMAVTLEESGLLGSAYFAENPFIPLDRLVAGVNIDAVVPIGRTRDIIIIGAGASELEDRLAAILAPAGRYLRPDPDPQAGYYYRSDHISLAKKGVPMLYPDGGVDALEGGETAGLVANAQYRASAYHNPRDNFDPAWDFSGLAEDSQALAELALSIADSSDWPQWREGNEFRAAHEALRAGAAAER